MVEMHINNTQPLYCEEANQRKFYYYPPLGGNYPNGWLWYDGNHHGKDEFWTYESLIVNRMNQPSPVTITMWGYFTPTTGNGTIFTQFRNDSMAAIDGRVLFVLTEDSIYYPAANFDSIHNHVARDYLPDHNGVTVSIPAGDSVTVSQPFSVQAAWDDEQCRIVTWIQKDIPQADSTKEIWQGGIKPLSELGVCEQRSDITPIPAILPIPNPCLAYTSFSFNLPAGVEYQINIFDVMGRSIRIMKGKASTSTESIKWNCRDDAGSSVRSGVYLYHFESRIINTIGKIIVR